VFAEQVSHHPPVSCWQVLDHDGQVRGTQQRPAGGRQLSNGQRIQQRVVRAAGHMTWVGGNTCRLAQQRAFLHVPVSCLFYMLLALLLYLLQFEYYGSSCWSATFMGNSVKGSQYGDSMLRFASDGAVITWSLPTIHIRGEAAPL
jgi:hypothetical protein